MLLRTKLPMRLSNTVNQTSASIYIITGLNNILQK